MTNLPYADAKELDELINVAGAMEFIGKVEEKSQDIVEYRKLLRTANTALQKLLELRYDKMNYPALQRVIKRLRGNFKIIQCNGNYSSKNYVTCTVNEFHLYELCEMVTEKYCYGCTNKNRRGCKVRKALHGVCCPAYNPAAKNGECEYRIEEFEE